LSCGIPVIAYNVGGMAEIVQDTHGKLLDAGGGPKEIARSLEEILTADETIKQKLRNNAHAFWNTHFNADKNYQDFIQKLMVLAKGEQL
ncbi:MAG TPA: glycosyltransferase, partial [Flavobacteriales bacterium]|nr:glycosyltransferase [Flavobacteriales bacterium]